MSTTPAIGGSLLTVLLAVGCVRTSTAVPVGPIETVREFHERLAVGDSGGALRLMRAQHANQVDFELVAVGAEFHDSFFELRAALRERFGRKLPMGLTESVDMEAALVRAGGSVGSVLTRRWRVGAVRYEELPGNGAVATTVRVVGVRHQRVLQEWELAHTAGGWRLIWPRRSPRREEPTPTERARAVVAAERLRSLIPILDTLTDRVYDGEISEFAEAADAWREALRADPPARR